MGRAEKKITKLLDNASTLSALRQAEAVNTLLRAELKLTRDKYKQSEGELAKANKRLSTFTSLADIKADARPKPKRMKDANGTAIIVLSDWHIEETVDADTVNGFNEFNLEIAEQRVNRTFNKALMLLEDARQMADIKEVVVALLGDFISGYIHPELAENNSLSPLAATREAARMIKGGLKTLLKHGGIESMPVVCCFDNHSRTTEKLRISTAADNSYGYDMYLKLADDFSGEKRMRWQVERGLHSWLDIQGHAARFHHGHAIRYQDGVGGLSIPANKAVAKWNQTRTAAVEFFGHHHTYTPGTKWICNGSLIGYSPLSIFLKAPFQRPQQTFAVVDRDRGLTRCLPIFCD